MRQLQRLQTALTSIIMQRTTGVQVLGGGSALQYQHPGAVHTHRLLAAASLGRRTSPCVAAAAAAAPAASLQLGFSLPFSSCSSSRGYAQSAVATQATSSRRKTSPTQAYGAEQIQVLEGLDPVRKRPGMYIGSTGPRGLHHLLWEVLDNAVDEVQGGFGDVVTVEVDLGTQTVTISDNGRGIPTDLHPATGKSALETVLTVLHAGGKFGGGSNDGEQGGSNGDGSSSGYRMSGGLHGVGISVVNALSEQLHVEVLRNGLLYRQSYSRGNPTTTLSEQPAPPGSYSSGTKVTFVPDASVFSPGITFDPDTIASRLRELAFLNAGATMQLRLLKHGQVLPLPAHSGSPKSAAAAAKAAKQSAAAAAGDESGGSKRRGSRRTSTAQQEEAAGGAAAAASSDGANGNGVGGVLSEQQQQEEGWQVFCFQEGLKEYVQWLNRDNHALHPPAVVSAVTGQVEVSVALQWVSDTFSDTLVGFANSIKTIDGGSHLDGLKAALTRLVNTAAKRNKLVKETDPALSGDHVREGLSGVISVKVPSPEFEGQTKTRLGNPEVRRQVDQVVTEQLGAWLDAHPAALSAIVTKALTAARAAEAARKARELVRRKSSLSSTTLPGKLADCTSSNKEESEIFIVEGDSAGGSAKQARDRRTQAILPLRGKILNVERKDDAALYKNQEIAALIVALGLGTKGGSSSSSSSKAGSRGSTSWSGSRRATTSSRVTTAAAGAGSPGASMGGEEEGEEEEGEGEATAAGGGGGSSNGGILKGLRYGKVVLLTDADVDGAHIRTLLLTFLFRYRRELFEQGRVYVAVPPLYRVETGRGQEPRWAYDEAGLQAILADISKTKAAAAAAAASGGAGGAGGQAAGRKGRASSRAKSASTAAAAAAAGGDAAGADEDGSSSAATAAVAAAAAVNLPPGVSVTRFKGLGEMMPEQLWSTTLNPETRVLRRLTLEDAAAASHTFVTLMGDKVAPRRALIEAEGQRFTLEQLDI